MRRVFLLSAVLVAIAGGASAQTVVSPQQSALHPDVLRNPDRVIHVYGYAEGVPTRYIATEESGNLPSNMTATSIRAVGQWEVCDGFLFSGECRIIEGNYQRIQRTGLRRIWSARPVAVGS